MLCVQSYRRKEVNGNGTAAGEASPAVKWKLSWKRLLCDHRQSFASGIHQWESWSEHGNKTFCFLLEKGLQSFSAAQNWNLYFGTLVYSSIALGKLPVSLSLFVPLWSEGITEANANEVVKKNNWVIWEKCFKWGKCCKYARYNVIIPVLNSSGLCTIEEIWLIR